ncbi:m7GpppX diphosphatase [Phytophthora nicotianae]|uniref:M7GpppX diphosphatase n=1 Tax=Phytophthora nicotianae TaxID=4792 RepID=A0A0W8D5N0_PHYNI|nr:m7GpppX diphosphatase [Phytophthora nicotianae]
MGPLDLVDQVERLGVGIALVAAVLGALYLWQQAVGDVGTTKMLRDFNLVRVLKRTDTELAVLGNFKSDNHKKAAVLIIQSAAMDTRTLSQLLAGISLHEILVNDIYSTFQGDVSRDIKPYKVNLIYPATERHVRKHTDQNFHMVVETKEAYRMITKPFIDSIPAENIDWVYNILDHKSETERIIYEDTHHRNGFVLLPDFKWSDPSKLESLYCLAIVHDRSLRSLRDLTGSHLKLLRNIRYELHLLPHTNFDKNSRFELVWTRNASLEVLNEKFGVDPSSIRMYLHYQPTYYHLHVHFSHVKMTQGTFSGKAVLLEDVIYNLSVNSDHYKDATLSFVVGEMQHKQLFELFREKHII